MEFLLSLKEDGLADPPALRNRPQLSIKEHYYQTVFHDLADSRGYGASGAPLPIPVSEIKAYCEFFGINTVTEREVLLQIVREMDRTFCKTVVGQMTEASKDTNTAPAVEG